MSSNKQVSEVKTYVYIAQMANSDLYFGRAGATSSLALTAKATRNPRMRNQPPMTLLRSWVVRDMSTACSAAGLLRLADLGRLRSALQQPDIELHELIELLYGPGAVIQCSQCGALARPVGNTRLCRTCYDKEPKAKCARCHQSSHHLSAHQGICPRCAEIVSRPVAKCAQCKKKKSITDQARGLCRACVKYLKQKAKPCQASRRVRCKKCGKVRCAGRKKEDICNACAASKHATVGKCTGCGKHRQFKIKSRSLCAKCAMDRSAPGMVRKFIRNFRSQFRGSQDNFELLARTVVPEDTTFRQEQRIANFGKYLMSHDLPSPLTWSAIDEVLVALPPKKSAEKDVRSCLLSLGHLLANEGRIESRADHLERRRLAERIANAAPGISATVTTFAKWSLGRGTTCSHVIAQVETVSALWTWCEEKKIASIFSLISSQINSYLMNSLFDLPCDCGGMASPDFNDEYGAATCKSCGSKGPFEEVERYEANTMRGVRVRLSVFFDWASRNDLVASNPMTSPGGPPRQIRHCSGKVLSAILKYIKDPNNDPTDALILYLTMTHRFEGWELQKVKFPREEGSSGEADLAAVYGVVAPDRTISLGRPCKSGRKDQRFTFPEDAREWLGPLLNRFQRQRTKTLDGWDNDFLFVAPGRARNNVPVCIAFLTNRVKKVTKSIVGFEIGFKLWIQTATVALADSEGSEYLMALGLSEEQATAYRLNARLLIG